MFSAICVIYMRDNGSSTELADNYVYIMIDIVGTTLLFIACLIFYRLDVRTLSKLSLEQVDVKWRMFLIPPAVFTILYSTGSTAQMIQYLDNSLGYNKDTVIAIFTFSTIIVYLLIWAFYVIIKNLNAASEIKTLSVEVMEALAHTIDAKDEYTRGHSVRVAKYSRMIAQKLGMSPVECENVYYMGLLHDLGKIGVPNEIINSPNKLTDEEYTVIKTHPGLGYDILSEMKSRPDLAIGARWHHERYDGKGYPDGKAGEDIPLYARIIAVADSYDAMTSNRSYRKYMPQQAVRSEIEKNSGTQFDPRFAACMIDIIDEDTEYVLHE
ncbi:MAG: HD-GYP domain-containing protein [Lachnospiraceae bacterium]|nr:HD-GYP domain-containing protein [Lachnospiraceae bacterium]